MEKENNYLEFEKYLLNELTTDELSVFDKRLEEDTAFATDFALYKEVNTTLSSRFSNYQEENKLRNTLEDLGTIHIKTKTTKTVEKQKEVKIFSLKKYSKYLVAASLILFGSLLWMNSNQSVNYSDFSNHDSIELVVRGDNNEGLLKAQKAFNSKDFATAQKEFEVILKEDGTKIELQLYLGIALLEQNKFELADSILSRISKGDSVYKNKATWYLALSKLKQKDHKALKNILKTLPKEADDYAKAQKILDKL